MYIKICLDLEPLNIERFLWALPILGVLDFSGSLWGGGCGSIYIYIYIYLFTCMHEYSVLLSLFPHGALCALVSVCSFSAASNRWFVSSRSRSCCCLGLGLGLGFIPVLFFGAVACTCSWIWGRRKDSNSYPNPAQTELRGPSLHKQLQLRFV